MLTPASAIFLGLITGVIIAYILIKKKIDLPFF